ncbi:MAG: hypothetical protein KIS96_14375 [Bauldia sp.]|nr:hypothetical protein [Bauldia sp.]
MGSLPLISEPQRLPYLNPPMKMVEPEFWMPRYERAKPPRPEWRSTLRWLLEPRDMQERMRRRRLSSLPPSPWERKKKRR